MQLDLRKEERKQIFSLFLTSDRLKFSEIEKRLGIRSNMVSYHLERMIKDQVVAKTGEYYKLTMEAERFLPYFSSPSALPVVLVAITKAGKVLIINRIKRPYKGLWGVPGGKLLPNESIKKASLRLAKDKAGLDVTFEKVCSITQEHVLEKGEIKHSFLLILVNCSLKGEAKDAQWLRVSTPGKLKVIPSDLHLLKTGLKSRIAISELELEEIDGEIVSFKLK